MSDNPGTTDPNPVDLVPGISLAPFRVACIIAFMFESLRLLVRLHLGRSVIVGPGKADLLAAVAATGSPTDPGHTMGMSYKCAWRRCSGSSPSPWSW